MNRFSNLQLAMIRWALEDKFQNGDFKDSSNMAELKDAISKVENIIQERKDLMSENPFTEEFGYKED